jgi:soluble lytic murein transglycosylase-like protein
MTGADPDLEHRRQGRRASTRSGTAFVACMPFAAFALCSPQPVSTDDAWGQGLGTAESSVGQAKFHLALQACGAPLVVSSLALPEAASAALSVSRPAAAPHEAAQLALYAQPATAPYAGTPIRTATLVTPLASIAPRASHTASRISHNQVARVRAAAPALARAARDYGIDPLLLHAVAHIESRHNPQAMSHAGARGLMQVMPATARRFGVQQPHHELLDPETNVRVSAEYLKTLQARFGNNLPLVLAAYNAGEGAVEKYGRKVPPYRETQAYVRMVIDTYLQLRAAAQRAAPGHGAGVTP